MSLGRNVTLYRDGEPVESASTPARFAVGEGAVIEVDASEHGFNRAVLHHAGGTDRLRPAAGTWEAAWARWGRQHPVLSRVVGVAATLAVLASLLLLASQLLEILTTVPQVQEVLGGWSFRSPIDLPPAALWGFGLVVGVAALERALRMR
ncbi:MAG TPA: hypothetical protein VK060_01340 [Ruania sp.]|nr:hypothetical protein [Ruania sp.]